MNKKTKYIQNIILLSAFLSAFNASGQHSKNRYPEVGKKCPDFLLTDIRYYKAKQAVLEDFKEKWFILDFWNRYCFMCLQSQPYIDSLQNEFKKEVQFMLVGYTGSQYRNTSDRKEIEEIYERNRQRNNLELAIAYDSVVFHQFDIKPTPHIVIIDPEGIVRGITYKLSRENLRALINNQKVDLPRAHRFSEFKAAKEAEKQAQLKKKEGTD